MSVLLAIPWHLYATMLVFAVIVGVATAIGLRDVIGDERPWRTPKSGVTIGG